MTSLLEESVRAELELSVVNAASLLVSDDVRARAEDEAERERAEVRRTVVFLLLLHVMCLCLLQLLLLLLLSFQLLSAPVLLSALRMRHG